MNLKLDLGQEILLPTNPVILTEGEVAVFAELESDSGLQLYRSMVRAYKAPTVLPLIVTSKIIRLKIRAISHSYLESSNETEAIEATKKFESLLTISSEFSSVPNIHKQGYTDEDLLSISDRIEIWLQSKLAQHDCIINSRPQLNDQEKVNLLLDLEIGSSKQSSNYIQQKTKDVSYLSLWRKGLEWLMEGQDRQIILPSMALANRKEYLHEILRHSDLVGREILLDKDSLEYNCGPLIIFRENIDEELFFRPKKSGYEIWEPSKMARSVYVDKGQMITYIESQQNLDPRAIAVQAALASIDTSQIGILRFTYGKPSENSLVLPLSIVIGFILGFLFSVGQEVGATRWIFGMTLLGSLLGITLKVLSPDFRVAVIVTLASTGIGLLIPTLNTILTNIALPERDINLILQMGAILFAATFLTISLNWIRASVLIATQQYGNTKLLLASLNRTLQLPTSFFSTISLGDLSLRFNAISELQSEIKQLIEGGAIKAIMTSIYILFMLRISVKLTILSVLISLALLVPTAVIGFRGRRLERKSQDAQGEAFGRNLELISSVSKLRMSGAEVSAARYWAESYKRAVAYSFSFDIQTSISKLLQTIVPNLGLLLLFIMVTKLISESMQGTQSNPLNAGELLGYFSAFGTFIGAMASLSDLAIGAADIPILWERAAPLLLNPIEILPDASDPGELLGSLSLDRVSYRYQADLPLTLDRISFEAAPGEFVALVGPSGSGKSTVVRMLLGFAMPEEGTIYYDGQPLNSLKLDLVRRQIGTVLQNAGIFSGSIFEIISGSSLISIEQAWEAAEMVGLAADIKDMPMGMQTVIPDGGGTLSGGQRQRLTIARALVRKPKILIFDEATSALDNRTQAVVTQSLERLNVTRIVIAHRLSTIRNANKIVVINRGQVVETGNYLTLMDNQGLFYQLMSRQIT